MISILASASGTKILLVLILLTAAIITTIKNILTLISIYSFQSFLIVLVAVSLYLLEKNPTILIIATLTLVSKVFLIPSIIRKVQRKLKIKRDVDFHHLNPISAIFLSSVVFFVVYNTFSDISFVLNNKNFLIAIALSVSLVFMGMIIMFTRKQTITNVIGYLTMENGVLLFGLFVAELPLIIDFVILLDLLMLIFLVTLLAFGIDSSIEEYHARFHSIGKWFKEEK